MTTQDTTPIKEKILKYIEKNGPSIPVHIAKEINQSMLFTSAFLSEIISENKLKMSHMKVGSSPIYFIPQKKEGVERFAIHLKSKEKEAFLLLKEKKFLKDSKQLPPIRVALRAIKDFAIPFKYHGEIYWRYFTNSTQEFKREEEPKKSTEPKVEPPIEEEKIKEEFQKEPQKIEPNLEQTIPKREEEIPKVESTEEKKEVEIFDKKEPFEKRVKKYLNKTNIKILEELEIKKREYLAIGRIDSEIGEIEVLIVAKDKKTLNEKDLQKTLEQLNSEKKLIILLCSGEIAKKAKEDYRKNKNLIRFQKIE